MSDFTTTIKGHDLEYFDDTHTYLVDGVIVPSITQILKVAFPDMYSDIPKKMLMAAAEKGTKVHDNIEKFCKGEEYEELTEVRNFAFLMDKYKFEVLENEIPVILFDDGEPICAGRLDLVLQMDGQIGGADIKRTSVLHKDYVALQLNLYRIAYRQCYDKTWEFLRAVHLRDEKRRFVKIPINEEYTLDFVRKYQDNLIANLPFAIENETVKEKML